MKKLILLQCPQNVIKSEFDKLHSPDYIFLCVLGQEHFNLIILYTYEWMEKNSVYFFQFPKVLCVWITYVRVLSGDFPWILGLIKIFWYVEKWLQFVKVSFFRCCFGIKSVESFLSPFFDFQINLRLWLS